MISDRVPTFFVPLRSVGGSLSVLINFFCVLHFKCKPMCQYLVLLFSQYFVVRTSRIPIFMGVGDVADRIGENFKQKRNRGHISNL